MSSVRTTPSSALARVTLVTACLVGACATAQGLDAVPVPIDVPSPVLSVELRDQFGNVDSLLRYRGSPVIAVVVSVRRLAMIERWERDLSARIPGLRFLNIADLPDDVPVDIERTAATLRKRVPDGVAVLMDPDRTWASSYALDTSLPNLLVFDAEGRLLARFRGRWNAELATQVAGVVPTR